MPSQLTPLFVLTIYFLCYSSFWSIRQEEKAISLSSLPSLLCVCVCDKVGTSALLVIKKGMQNLVPHQVIKKLIQNINYGPPSNVGRLWVHLRMHSRSTHFDKSTFQEWMCELHSQTRRFQGLSIFSFYAFLFLSKAKLRKCIFKRPFLPS